MNRRIPLPASPSLAAFAGASRRDGGAIPLPRWRVTRAAAAAIVLLGAAACDDEPPTEAPPPPPPIELTIVSPEHGSVFPVHHDIELLATATAPDLGSLPNDSVRWSVDGDVLVPGPSHTIRLAPGQHTLEVTARYGERSATQAVAVTVNEVPVGTVLWRSSLGVSSFGGLSAGDDGTLYAQEGTSELLALRPDGTLHARFSDLPGPLGEHPPTILPDGSVLLGTWLGVLALASDGMARWEYRTTDIGAGPEDHVHGGVAVGQDGTIYFGTDNYDGVVVALWPDGTERWVTTVLDSVPTTPAGAWQFLGAPVLVGDSLVVLIERDSEGIVGLDARNGAVKWRWESGYSRSSAQLLPAVAANGDVVVALRRHLVRIDPAGNVVWVVDGLPDWFDIEAVANAPAIAGGRIYVPAGRGLHVYEADGSYVGAVGSAGYPRGAVTVGRGGIIYVVDDRALTSFAPDGSLRYEVEISGAQPINFWAPSGPVLAPDGTVFVHAGADGVIAVADTVGPSAGAEWPTTGGGFGRLGRRH